jgi:hypothetical protein
MTAFSLLLGEPLHFLMQTRQFHGLRTRVGAGLSIGDRGPQADRHGCGRRKHEGARRAPIAAAMGRRLGCRPAPR